MPNHSRRASLNHVRHALLGYQAMARRTGDVQALASAQAGLEELTRVERIVADAAMKIETAADSQKAQP